nr:hypothetical protein OH820_17880 [Streptomyces sp. NBC_00857]
MWRGKLAPRRVLDLVEHLPTGSALAANLGGDPSHRGWDLHAHLMAHVVDAAHHTAWVIAQTQSRKQIPYPKPLPRPGRQPAARGPLDLSRHPLAQPLPERYRNAPP